MAAAISIVHAACEQPHRIRAIPATFAGAIAAAATPARCRRFILIHQKSPTARGSPFAAMASSRLSTAASGTANVVTVGWNKTTSGAVPNPRWTPIRQTPAPSDLAYGFSGSGGAMAISPLNSYLRCENQCTVMRQLVIAA